MSSSHQDDDDKPDLETQIREAELKIIETDRQWQRHRTELTVAVQSHAKQAALWGSVGLGAVLAVAGSLLLRGRSSPRLRLPAPPPRLTRAAKRAMRAAAAPSAPMPRTFAGKAMSAAGTLLGSAMRSGVGPGASKPGLLSMLFGIALPLLSRWWRSRDGAAAAPPGRSVRK